MRLSRIVVALALIAPCPQARTLQDRESLRVLTPDLAQLADAQRGPRGERLVLERLAVEELPARESAGVGLLPGFIWRGALLAPERGSATIVVRPSPTPAGVTTRGPVGSSASRSGELVARGLVRGGSRVLALSTTERGLVVEELAVDQLPPAEPILAAEPRRATGHRRDAPRARPLRHPRATASRPSSTWWCSTPRQRAWARADRPPSKP